jgi:hypothetical protein
VATDRTQTTAHRNAAQNVRVVVKIAVVHRKTLVVVLRWLIVVVVVWVVAVRRQLTVIVGAAAISLVECPLVPVHLQLMDVEPKRTARVPEHTA